MLGRCPLNPAAILLRGCSLRNTEVRSVTWVREGKEVWVGGAGDSGL